MHKDYQLALEKLAILYDMLSDYCKSIAEEYGTKVDDVKRLVPNLSSKAKYIVHYINLQLYLFLGMKLTKIHRVLKFQQSDWMKYILILTQKKKQTLLTVLKLIINSDYGKTMGNLRKRIRLLNNEKDFLKYTSRPSHITHKIVDKNCAAIHEIKPVSTPNKPLYVGFTVPELSNRLCMTSATTLF